MEESNEDYNKIFKSVSVIAISAGFEEEAIDILRHLSTVDRLWKQKITYEGITELETEYTRALGEEFLPELRMP